jgi:hypothetical protein|tara:strand:+ start:765 stop:1004 length:240 start_codon:yes stop_codon:yes gene_type:complete
MNKLIGKEVIGDYGAMIPIAEGVIAGSRISDDLAHREVLINWEGGDSDWIPLLKIKKPDERTANGSPIGIFWKSVFFEK